MKRLLPGYPQGFQPFHSAFGAPRFVISRASIFFLDVHRFRHPPMCRGIKSLRALPTTTTAPCSFSFRISILSPPHWFACPFFNYRFLMSPHLKQILALPLCLPSVNFRSPSLNSLCSSCPLLSSLPKEYTPVPPLPSPF